ncbi:MAG: hypothetical protein CM1200mP10_15660 [Candidatus Neomarinimicrobiota bacterium]|nr:MAG: hypothetical protein CM1200mP10_15660 [Candidatus Neomarinimicrobiota bacterium]
MRVWDQRRALLAESDQFIQIVSCNTHNISCITKTIALDGVGSENFVAGKYVCIRRANDMHQEGGYIPSPQVNDIFQISMAHTMLMMLLRYSRH